MISLVRPFSHIIPRARDRKGNTLQRRFYHLRPLITHDPEALIETAQALANDVPTVAARMAQLKARSAIAAAANCLQLRAELEQVRLDRNADVEELIAQAEAKRTELVAVERVVEAELAAMLAPLGIRSALTVGDEEPDSLPVLAGRHRLPSPEVASGWWQRSGYRWVASVGGGIVFGASLGLLTGKLELVDLSEEWGGCLFWGSVGMIVMTLVGAVLFGLGKSVSSALYRRRVERPIPSGLQVGVLVSLLVGLASAMVAVESKVEQLGLFKAVADQSSLHSARLSRPDLLWCSLMLALPAVASYIWLGVVEGERTANLDRLRSLQAESRAELRQVPAFAHAARLEVILGFVRSEVERLDTRLADLRQEVRHELTLAERQRLEDVEIDVAAHAWAAEDALMLSPPIALRLTHPGLPHWLAEISERLGWGRQHAGK